MNLLHILSAAHANAQPHAAIHAALTDAGKVREQRYSTSAHAADLKRIIEAHPAGTIDFILVELTDTPEAAAATSVSGQNAAAASSASSSSAATPTDGNGRPGDAAVFELLSALARAHRTAFICVSTIDARGIEDARFRWNCFEQRVQMVTVAHAAEDLKTALERVSKLRQQRLAAASSKEKPRCYRCPICEQSGLPEDTLHAHLPLYHANFAQRKPIECPICHRSQRSFGPHMQNDHGPPSRGEAPCEHVTLNVINPVVLCVVRRPSDGKFLMVRPHKTNSERAKCEGGALFADCFACCAAHRFRSSLPRASGFRAAARRTARACRRLRNARQRRKPGWTLSSRAC